MRNDGGEITVTLRMDSKQFYATAAAADAAGKTLGNKLDTSTKAATDRVGARFATFGAVAQKALLGTAVVAGVAGVASVKMAGDFEQSLNVLKSVTGATGEEMAKLSARARELGKDATLPGISSRDAAQAMTELAKAGVSVNNIMGASKGVLSLAKAGNLDVAEAATIAARALNAFGLKGTEAGRVADILAAGANASSADVDEMALALAQASASASRMGLSLDDTVAALGLFSNAGISGSDAGTSLKTMLARLVPTTKKAKEAMQELGLNFFDGQGKFVGLENAAGQLQSKLGGLSQEQRELAINTIFGSDASRAAGIFAKQGAKGFDAMSKAVNRQGAATELAKAQNSGFNGALDNLKSTLETIGTDLGTKLLPPLTKFLQVLANGLEPAVNFLIANGKVLSIVLATLATSFVAIRTAAFVGDLMKAQKTLALFVGAKNAAGIKILATAFKTLGTVAMTAIRGIGAAILANPIVAAIAAVIAILIFLQVKFNIFGKLFEAIKPVLASVGKFFVSVWQKISNAFTTAVNAIANFWNTKLKPVFDFIVAVIMKVAEIYFKIWAAIALVVVGTMFIIGQAIWTAMQAIWNVISTVFNAVWGVISKVLTTIWNAITAYFNFYLTITRTVFTAILNFVRPIWNTIYGVISGAVSKVYNFIVAVFTRVFNFYRSIWNSIYGAVSGAVSRIWGAVSGTFNRVVDFVGGIGGRVLKSIGNLGGVLYNKGRDLINGLLKGAGSLLGKIGEFFLEKLPSPIRGAFKRALGISSPSKVFAGYGKNIVEGLANGIKGNLSMAGAAADKLAAQVGSINAGLASGNINVNADGSAAVGGAPGGIQQTNNIYNQVDLEQVNRELAWQVRR